MLIKRLIVALLSLLLLSCSSYKHKASKNDLNHLVDLMTGSFSSLKQSQSDKEYFDIRLEMVQIWPDNNDGKWLYVEQAVSTYLDKPYRQRIYHVTQLSDDKFSSAVYELPSPEDFIGAYKDVSILSELRPDQLIAREGCAVILNKTGHEKYSGSTIEKSCLSSLRGAQYATSIVTIDNQKILSWDRGYNADDEHVWGAEKGAYIFNKNN